MEGFQSTSTDRPIVPVLAERVRVEAGGDSRIELRPSRRAHVIKLIASDHSERESACATRLTLISRPDRSGMILSPASTHL